MSAGFTNCSARTEGQIRITTVIWTVPNFLSLLNNKNSNEVQTEEIGDAENKFRLKMQFMGLDHDIIQIYYLSTAPVLVKSALTICLKHLEERTMVIKEYQMITANKWQYLATLVRLLDKVSYEGKDIFLLNNGSLRLKIDIMVMEDIKINQTLIPEEVKLSNDFEHLLNNGMFADVIIRSIDGAEYNTHKAVLASRSTVLRALFERDMNESHTNIVESPLESEILYVVLTFIYSDKAPRLDEIPEKLLAAADYYQLTRLKCLCEEALQKKLTVDNAIDTLQLADLHSAPVLKNMTLKFMKDGHAHLITQTKAWSNIRSVELIKTIYEFIISDDLEADMK